mmetsp:Transcript_60401/g.95173  ORF Transcript_60401/g.95173 Transcript_60401/m.95173 type:complete len:253 (+) Transcript_60401:455-1213(+)
MLSGLKFVHANYLVHRDIKPESFTVGGFDCSTLKLGDFSLSAQLQKGKIQGVCATRAFMAPEVISGACYDEKIDLWSFGVLVYMLLFGEVPYPYNHKDRRSNQDCNVPNQGQPSFASPVNLSYSAVAFVKSFLKTDPCNRPSAESALKKAYMVSVQKGEHHVETDLTCLKATLARAKQTRALESRGESQAVGLGDLLSRMQMKAFGIPLSCRTSDSQSTRCSQPQSAKSARTRTESSWCLTNSSASVTGVDV